MLAACRGVVMLSGLGVALRMFFCFRWWWSFAERRGEGEQDNNERCLGTTRFVLKEWRGGGIDRAMQKNGKGGRENRGGGGGEEEEEEEEEGGGGEEKEAPGARGQRENGRSERRRMGEGRERAADDANHPSSPVVAGAEIRPTALLDLRT
jgi:hypothetical protein